MFGNALLVLGSTVFWVGVCFGFVGLWRLCRYLFDPQHAPRQLSSGFGFLLGATALLAIGALTGPKPVSSTGPHLPLAWPIPSMPALFCVASLVIALGTAISGYLGVDRELVRSRLQSALVWLLIGGVAGYWWYDSKEQVTWLTGFIQVTPGLVAGLLVSAVAATAAMAWAARTTESRVASKKIVTHIALAAGAVVFGLPFVWLLITSFKEDRDTGSAEGIVWVPMISEQADYMDPDQPMVRDTYQGVEVEGNITQTYADGSALIDITKPGVMRGMSFTAQPPLKRIPKRVPVVRTQLDGAEVAGKVIREFENGGRRLELIRPPNVAGKVIDVGVEDWEPIRQTGIRWQNYSDALEFLPLETQRGLVYFRNSAILVVLNVLGSVLVCGVVAYSFARIRFPGKEFLFILLLSTLMLPGAVTLLPTFLIFKSVKMVDTLFPLWIPAWFGNAFYIFLLRQFFSTIPMELEDAAKIDGCSFLKTFWTVMLPQVKPALAVIAIWALFGTWNDFMGPLVYINSPEFMPVSYAVQLFQSDRNTEQALVMAFSTMAVAPILIIFIFAQRFFIEGVQLSGLGGR